MLGLSLRLSAALEKERGNREGGHGCDSEDTGQETSFLPHSGPIITGEETGQGGAVALAGGSDLPARVWADQDRQTHPPALPKTFPRRGGSAQGRPSWGSALCPARLGSWQLRGRLTSEFQRPLNKQLRE